MAVEFLDLIAVLPYADIRAGHDFLVDVLGFARAGSSRRPTAPSSTVRCAPGRSAAGCTSAVERESTDEDDGQREYGLRDPEGHRWFIATAIS